MDKKFKLATCCLLGDVPNIAQHSYRKTTKTAFLKTQDTDHLLSLWQYNIKETERALLFLCSQDSVFHFFRVSSDIFPLATLPEVQDFYKSQLPHLRSLIKDVGVKIKTLSPNFRLVTHPGQFSILNSRNLHVVQNAVIDLQYHYDFMSAFELPFSINIHLGSGPDKDDPLSHIDRFSVGWNLLPQEIRHVLSIENDEKVADISTVIHLYKRYGVKICYDAHHQACFLSSSKYLGEYKPFILSQEQIELIEASWSDLNLVPTMHLSNRREINSIGSKAFPHSDMLYEKDFNNDSVGYLLRRGWFLECEAKAKFPACQDFLQQINSFS